MSGLLVPRFYDSAIHRGILEPRPMVQAILFQAGQARFVSSYELFLLRVLDIGGQLHSSTEACYPGYPSNCPGHSQKDVGRQVFYAADI